MFEKKEFNIETTTITSKYQLLNSNTGKIVAVFNTEYELDNLIEILNKPEPDLYCPNCDEYLE